MAGIPRVTFSLLRESAQRPVGQTRAYSALELKTEWRRNETMETLPVYLSKYLPAQNTSYLPTWVGR